MVLPQQVNVNVRGEGDVQFSWGRKMGVQYYESFTYNRIAYSLYDCVYMRSDDEAEPGIGKLVKIFETSTGIKKVKVVWFFRPVEIQYWLGDIKPLPKELFLASGEGKGLFNFNLLEIICGKCSVICISKDRRNPLPTVEELRKADYVFYRTFDVKTCTVSKIFSDLIAEVKVENYFNQRKDLKPLHPAKGSGSLSPTVVLEKKAYSFVKDCATGLPDTSTIRKRKLENASGVPHTSPLKNIKLENASSVPETSPLKKKFGSASDAPDMSLPKKRKLEKHSGPFPQPKASQGKDSIDIGVNVDHKVSKFPARDNLEKNNGMKTDSQMVEVDRVNVDHKVSNFPARADHLEKNKGMETNFQMTEVARRPNMDPNGWFKEQPWVIRMPIAQENGTLVLLKNLDPSFTSADVEDILWHAFRMKASVKMIQHSTFSSPHSGKAFAIFTSKKAADFVISDLKMKCLMLGDGRPLIAQTGALKKPSNPSAFVGHQTIERMKPQRQRQETDQAKEIAVLQSKLKIPS